MLGRFETEWLATDENLAVLSDLSGIWIDRIHDRKKPKIIILDMDSTESSTHGDQEGSAYNGHFGCTCYHPLFCFNQFGDLERCLLRPGNVHSAEDWRLVFEPVVARYRDRKLRRFFRADGAFAKPEIYEFLEAEGYAYAIRLPTNAVLQERIAHLLTRPVGRPPNHVRVFHASFSFRAATWDKPRRVVAKVEWHPGELYPKVGFIVTNLSRPAERVTKFYNGPGTAEHDGARSAGIWADRDQNSVSPVPKSALTARHACFTDPSSAISEQETLKTAMQRPPPISQSPTTGGCAIAFSQLDVLSGKSPSRRSQSQKTAQWVPKEGVVLKKILLPVIFVVLTWGFWVSPEFKEISAGVAIFLFGMMSLEEGFKAFTGGVLEKLLHVSTNKLWKSLGFGMIVTTLHAVELTGLGHHHLVPERRADRPGAEPRHHLRLQHRHHHGGLASRRGRPEGRHRGLCPADDRVRRHPAVPDPTSR